jgi:hypothetical protein
MAGAALVPASASLAVLYLAVLGRYLMVVASASLVITIRPGQFYPKLDVVRERASACEWIDDDPIPRFLRLLLPQFDSSRSSSPEMARNVE